MVQLGKRRRRVAAVVAAVVVLGGCEWQSDLVSGGSGGGASGNARSFDPVYSPNGTTIAFESIASDLVANDTNGDYDVFVRDLATGATTLVSANAAGTDSANAGSYDPAFSPDGDEGRVRELRERSRSERLQQHRVRRQGCLHP